MLRLGRDGKLNPVTSCGVSTAVPGSMCQKVPKSSYTIFICFRANLVARLFLRAGVGMKKSKHIGVNVPIGTHERLKNYIKQNNPKYGNLTMSGVVADMIARCLTEEGFYDPWGEMKRVDGRREKE